MSGVRSWGAVSAIVGGAVSAGWLSKPSPPLTSVVEGLVLGAMGVVAFVAARPLARRMDEGTEDSAGHVSGYGRLFVISFVILFVELVLIRYAVAQVRVFSFYKNIPMIGAFLGLGLGCFVGGGTRGDLVRFLLWVLPLNVALAAGAPLVEEVLGVTTATVASEHVLGDFVPTAHTASSFRTFALELAMATFCAGALWAIAGLFVFLGKHLGEAFVGLAHLPAYSANIAGSLAGVVAFTAACQVESPPWVWFAVGLAPLLLFLHGRTALLGAGLIVLAATAVAPQDGETVWSAYQKLVGRPVTVLPRGQGQPGQGYLVHVSDAFYQLALDLRPQAIDALGWNPYPHYEWIYRRIGSAGDVLIVGAGTGNDVAAALRAGAREVVAVEIDPAIVGMGLRRHPEKPYADPHVRVIVDDARAAFRHLPERSFDVVVFGLLDSHTPLVASSVRLDNYVFTLESLMAAVRLIRPGGHLAVTAATFQPWFKTRLHDLVATAAGAPVEVETITTGAPWTTYLAEIGDSRPSPDPSSVDLPTDDWPFIYLPYRGVPRAYAMAVLFLVIASVFAASRAGVSFGSSIAVERAHLFFLGAAFLLLEVHAVNRLALVFGTTWFVSAAAIATVLCLILASNMTLALVAKVGYGLAYAGLFASLAASWAVPPDVVLGQPSASRFLYAGLCLSPIYFAGLIFARSFDRTAEPKVAMASNILGSVVGGWAEYLTMVFGIRGMVVLAALFYAGSLAALAAAQPGKIDSPDRVPVP